MTNEQLAHDLAVARMAGKQLPADVLVKEYTESYQSILDYLNSDSSSEPPKGAEVKVIPRPF